MRLGFRNCLIGDEVLVEPSVCKINYEIKHGMYAHVTPGGMWWNSCKQIQNSFAAVAAYPRPHQDSLLRNSPVTKYLKSHSADGQHYKFVSELLRRSKTRFFACLFFTIYGKHGTQLWTKLLSIIGWLLASSLMACVGLWDYYEYYDIECRKRHDMEDMVYIIVPHAYCRLITTYWTH